MQETQDILNRSLDGEDPLEEEMATHSSTLAWKITWTEEPGGLQFMGSQRVRYDWVSEHMHAHRREKQIQTQKLQHTLWSIGKVSVESIQVFPLPLYSLSANLEPIYSSFRKMLTSLMLDGPAHTTVGAPDKFWVIRCRNDGGGGRQWKGRKKPKSLRVG